jgi:hypothetical protein
MCLKYILVGFTLPLFFIFPPTPLLRTISADFILFSYMDTKYIYHIYPHSPFPCALLPPTGIHPQKRFIFSFCLSFFKIKCILIVQGCFTLILLYTLCFYQINPFHSITHSFSTTYSPNMLHFNVQCIILYSYINRLF